jgi:hypothetical protein
VPSTRRRIASEPSTISGIGSESASSEPIDLIALRTGPAGGCRPALEAGAALFVGAGFTCFGLPMLTGGDWWPLCDCADPPGAAGLAGGDGLTGGDGLGEAGGGGGGGVPPAGGVTAGSVDVVSVVVVVVLGGAGGAVGLLTAALFLGVLGFVAIRAARARLMSSRALEYSSTSVGRCLRASR